MSEPTTVASAPDKNRQAYKRDWQRRRRRERGVKALVLAACGTPAAYRRHLRNSEPVDDLCREAHNRDARERRQRSKS